MNDAMRLEQTCNRAQTYKCRGEKNISFQVYQDFK